MKSMQSNNKLKIGEEPSPLLYLFICSVTRVILKLKYNIRINNTDIKNLKSPFIVLGNHASNFDPFIMALALLPHRINLLGTNYYFRNPVLRPVIKALGVIPKVQFYKDPRAVRMMNKVISRGGAIGIFPEGRRSIDGSQSEITNAISKLIKFYKVPVAVMVSNGAYLSRPRWSNFNRKGTIEVSVRRMLNTEEIEELSVDEIQSKVCKELYFNDYEWNRAKKVSFNHKKIAESIHNVLHSCPSCESEKSMVSMNNRLYCRLCNNGAKMDQYGFLNPEDENSVVFEDTVKWYEWQKNKMSERIKDGHFSISSRVIKLFMADAFIGLYHNKGEGEVILKHDGLTFRGIIDKEEKELFFPLQVLSSISSEFGVSFEITDGKDTYCFFLEDGQDVVIFELAISLMKVQ